MVDASTDFYKHVDNFAKFAHVGWRCVCGDERLLEKVFVTISIPTYNRPDTLKDSIDSALNQEGYDDYCVMVVDNDPTEGTETEKLIRSYNSEKLLYFKNEENIGMFGNQNRCFEIPKSEYVLLLHDDDMIIPCYLKVCVRIIKEKRIDGLQPARFEWFESKCKKEDIKIIPSKKKEIRRYRDIDNYWTFTTGSQTGGIYRRTSFIAVGGYNSDYYPTSDYCLGVQLMERYKIYAYTDILSIYRIGSNESLKQETLELFLINDYYLGMQILKKMRINSFFIYLLLNYKAYTQYLGLKEKFNHNFNFDFRKLNMKYKCPRCVVIPLRLYVLIKLFALKKVLNR